MDDAVRPLRRGYVTHGEDVSRKAFLLPGFAVVTGERYECAVFVNMFLMVGIVVGYEEEPARGEPDNAGPLAAGQRIEGRGGFVPRFAAVEAGGQRHVAVDGGVLASEAEQVAVVCDDERCVAAGGAASRVIPGFAVVVRGPDGRDGPVAIGIAAG